MATVYTFSFTTLWFHTVKQVAPSVEAAAAMTRRGTLGNCQPRNVRCATRNQIAALMALVVAASRFTRPAYVSGNGISAKAWATSTNSGLPGGWGMPNTLAAAMYSLASHMAVVGASVTTYSNSTTAPTEAATA